MITCKLHQQYGNQIFEIAATIATAKRYGYEYMIPTHSINESKFPSYHYNNVRYGDIELTIYKDDERKYTPITNRDNICLYGYFQDYNYFMDYFDDVRDALALDWKMNEGKISIHVRRGDYLRHPEWFPTVNTTYIENSINHFKELGYNDFVVFGDDADWNKGNITSDKLGVNIEYSEGKHPIDDLKLMANCEHQIVANSTFSVWAAYLNRNPNKIVIRPPFFLGERGKHLHKNIYLENWIIKNNL